MTFPLTIFPVTLIATIYAVSGPKASRHAPTAPRFLDTERHVPKDGPVRSDNVIKHIGIAFAIAVVLYIASFSWIQHRRTFKGPWEITFATDANGGPSLKVSQPYLKISETIDFPGQKTALTNLNSALRFNEPVNTLPFGEMVFQDPTFLPGSVVMRLFGHQIELLPRVLIVDHKEIPWRSGESLEVGQPVKSSP